MLLLENVLLTSLWSRDLILQRLHDLKKFRILEKLPSNKRHISCACIVILIVKTIGIDKIGITSSKLFTADMHLLNKPLVIIPCIFSYILRHCIRSLTVSSRTLRPPFYIVGRYGHIVILLQLLCLKSCSSSFVKSAGGCSSGVICGAALAVILIPRQSATISITDNKRFFIFLSSITLPNSYPYHTTFILYLHLHFLLTPALFSCI